MKKRVTTLELADMVNRLGDNIETIMLSLGQVREHVAAVDARCKERGEYCDKIRTMMARQIDKAGASKRDPLLADIRWGRGKMIKVSAALLGAGGLGLALARLINFCTR